MKKILLCLAVLALSSCISVDDLGAYWNKGTTDKALVGRWEKIVPEGEKKEESQIAIKDGVYRIDVLDEEERRKEGYEPMIARTLKAGDYLFLMTPNRDAGKPGPMPGNIVRYELRAGILQTYDPVDPRISAFIREKHPAAKSIGDPSCASTCSGSLRIYALDDEAAGIISEIPATGEFWTPAAQWRKTR
jgi:hypothetical protein